MERVVVKSTSVCLLIAKQNEEKGTGHVPVRFVAG